MVWNSREIEVIKRNSDLIDQKRYGEILKAGPHSNTNKIICFVLSAMVNEKVKVVLDIERVIEFIFNDGSSFSLDVDHEGVPRVDGMAELWLDEYVYSDYLNYFMGLDRKTCDMIVRNFEYSLRGF